MRSAAPRLIFLGYGLSALGGVAAFNAGVSLTSTLLGFWIGGAALTLVLALLSPALRRPLRDEDADDRALAVALAAWEADRLADRSPGEGAAPEADGRRQA